MSHFIKESVPNYLRELPIPEELEGWSELSFRDWCSLIPPTCIVIGIGWVAYLACNRALEAEEGNSRTNQKIHRDKKQVTDTVYIEDCGKRVALCRCWNSNTWPICDQSHIEHNKLTCDNVGPVILKRKHSRPTTPKSAPVPTTSC